MTSVVEQNIPYPRRVFCNRNLRMDSLRWIGFDMDYTLARYSEALEHLQAEMVLTRLAGSSGVPQGILDAANYEPDFAIRGLTVDLEHGHVFKMDAHRFVGRVWHGGGPLDRELRRELFTNRKVSPSSPTITMVDTLFALPEISLYCQLVAAVDRETAEPDYAALWSDLRQAMDTLHADGTLKARIVADLPRFVWPDPELGETLHRFRSAGKKLFLLTNSEPEFTESVMSFLLDGQHPAYRRWRDYFDIVGCSARKPRFFVSDDPFLEVGADGAVATEPATSLRKDVTYVGGNVQALSEATGMAGDEVLYVGDHIYGDILRSKSHTSWRTALVVQEMERELERMQEHRSDLAELHHLEQRREALNLEIAAMALDGERDGERMQQARALGARCVALEGAITASFNEAWGMLFRDRAELSAFGAQVEDYACVYTSRVSNFRRYSPRWYFRSPRDWMAHELLP